MLHGISWAQFLFGYMALYVTLAAVVLAKKLPAFLKSKSRPLALAGVTADSAPTRPRFREAPPPPAPQQRVEITPVEKAKAEPIWQPTPPPENQAPMSEAEMYDLTSLAMDELDELFNASFSEEWSKEDLMKQLHRKLQAYLRLINTKMYLNINNYIEHQALSTCAIELSIADVQSLW